MVFEGWEPEQRTALIQYSIISWISIQYTILDESLKIVRHVAIRFNDDGDTRRVAVTFYCRNSMYLRVPLMLLVLYKISSFLVFWYMFMLMLLSHKVCIFTIVSRCCEDICICSSSFPLLQHSRTRDVCNCVPAAGLRHHLHFIKPREPSKRLVIF